MDEAEISVASASIQVSGITADKLEIDSVSGSTDITDTSCRSFELDTVSGSVRSSGLTAGSAETDSVSGPVQLEGSFGKIQYDTISGSFRAGSAICPERIEGSSVSGSVHHDPRKRRLHRRLRPGQRRLFLRLPDDRRQGPPRLQGRQRPLLLRYHQRRHLHPPRMTGKTPGAHNCAPGVCLFSRRPSIEGAG
ncbi:MAG: DUF4097 family beta strand repeat-containing protein [Anaerotruncus massiliensis (ex Togo et al. 2019)]